MICKLLNPHFLPEVSINVNNNNKGKYSKFFNNSGGTWWLTFSWSCKIWKIWFRKVKNLTDLRGNLFKIRK